MLKIEKNEDTLQTIDILKNNIIQTMRFWDIIDSYKRKKGNTLIEKELLEKYRGFNIDLKTLKLDSEEFYSMPYNKNIKLDIVKGENVEVREYHLKKGFLEPIDFGNCDRYLKNPSMLAYYKKDIIAPVIVENGRTWMSPTLAEKNTMKNEISKAHGNVLTFGLGIGYFQYNCLLKDEVKSVTIVENNEEIIKFFKENILPQFNTDKKVEIINGDLYDYYNDDFLNKFDYTFVDIWKNEEDGFVIYEKLMKIDIKYQNIDYWIEDAIVYTLKMMMAIYFKAIYDKRLTEKLNEFGEDDGKHLIRIIHRYFRGQDILITKGEQLIEFINDKDVIKNILRK